MKYLKWYNFSDYYMMRKTILIYLFTLLTIAAFAQEIKKEFEGKLLTTDQFGNYYEVFDNQIKKYNVKGELLFTYSNNLLGEITSLDVSNPLKILVYFSDFTKILTLDDALSPWGEVLNLNDLNLEETSLVCASYNYGVWYYNPLKFLLTRVQNKSVTNTSSNISTLLGINVQPNYMVEENDRVYLNDPINGILVFDVYGTYLKTIPLYGLKEFQVKEKFIISVNEHQQIETYDFFTLEKHIYMPEKYTNVKTVRVEGKNIFILKNNHELIIDKIAL